MISLTDDDQVTVDNDFRINAVYYFIISTDLVHYIQQSIQRQLKLKVSIVKHFIWSLKYMSLQHKWELTFDISQHTEI